MTLPRISTIFIFLAVGMFFFKENQIGAVTAPQWTQEVPVSVLTEREVISRASLRVDPAPALYEFQSTVRVNGSVQDINSLLRNYEGLQNWIPYLQRSHYHEKEKLLDIRGGIWGWYLESQLQIEEKSSELLRFEIVRGHLRGLSGEVELTKASSLPKGGNVSGTVIRISGLRKGGSYPPVWLMERGAEIVLGLGGKKLRSLIEARVLENKKSLVESEPGKEKADEEKYPKPKSSF